MKSSTWQVVPKPIDHTEGFDRSRSIGLGTELAEGTRRFLERALLDGRLASGILADAHGMVGLSQEWSASDWADPSMGWQTPGACRVA